MLKAVIFDVDGTLVDSVDLHAHAWVDAFHDFGHEVGFQEAWEQIGKRGDHLLPVFLSEAEIDKEGQALEKHREKVLKERYLHHVTAFPDVRELFEKLLSDGKKIALASSAKEAELELYEETAQISDLVHVQTSSDDAKNSRPHPDIFQAAMMRLGPDVQPAEVIVIGDTPYDAEAARKAGLRTVGLLCGGWSEAQLKEAGCVAVYKDPSDLLQKYATSPLAELEAEQ